MLNRGIVKLMYSMNGLNMTSTEQSQILDSLGQMQIKMIIGLGLIVASFLVINKIAKRTNL